MAVSQSDTNDMYERVFACLDTEFTDLPAGSGGQIAANGLRDAYAIIQSKSSEQSGFGDSAQAGSEQRAAARFNLKKYRSRLAETADIIARKKTGFDEHFPAPSRETDNELVANSRAVAAKAVEMKADFMERGLTEDYLQSGDDLVDAFEATLDTKNEALSHRGAAVGSKRSAYSQAGEHFDELDIYIRNHYADQPGKLHAWRNATHIEKASKKKKDDGDGTPTE